MKMKMIIASILTITMLAGCSSAESSESNSNDNKQTTSKDETKKEEDGEKTVLKVWGMGSEGTILSEIEPDFESEYPSIDLDIQALPWDSAHDKLLTAVASGKGPDVVQMGTSWIPEFADAGALLDITPHLEEYPSLAQNNYFEGSIEAGTYNDEYVGVPWYVDTRVLYYRKDLLEEVGYPNGPSTWDELKESSTKLSARGEGLYGINLDPKDQFFSMTYGWQNGAKIIEDNKSLLTEPEFIEAVEYINSFFKEGLAPLTNDMDIIQAFKEGNIPMFISGPWMIPSIKENAAEIDGKWGVRTLPAKQNNTSFVGGANFTIFKSSENVDAALKFISYMNEVDTQLKWLELSSTLPSRVETWEEDMLKQDEFYSVFGEQLENVKPSPVHPKWEAIAQEINATLEKINIGNKDIKEELAILNEKVQNLLDS